MRSLKKNIAIMLTFAMLSVLLCNIDAKADNLIDYTEDIYEMDCMQPYLEIINEVNEEYGTEMAVPTEEIIASSGLDKIGIVNYYLKINIEDFKDFLIDLYTGSQTEGIEQAEDEVYSNGEMEHLNQADSKECPLPMSSPHIQRIVFKNGNYLFFEAIVYYAEGANRYSTITGYGYYRATSPYYVPDHLYYSYGNGQTEVTCSFRCYLYLSEGILATVTPKTFKAKFTSGGGDVYEASEV